MTTCKYWKYLNSGGEENAYSLLFGDVSLSSNNKPYTTQYVIADSNIEVVRYPPKTARILGHYKKLNLTAHVVLFEFYMDNMNLLSACLEKEQKEQKELVVLLPFSTLYIDALIQVYEDENLKTIKKILSDIEFKAPSLCAAGKKDNLCVPDEQERNVCNDEIYVSLLDNKFNRQLIDAKEIQISKIFDVSEKIKKIKASDVTYVDVDPPKEAEISAFEKLRNYLRERGDKNSDRNFKVVKVVLEEVNKELKFILFQNEIKPESIIEPVFDSSNKYIHWNNLEENIRMASPSYKEIEWWETNFKIDMTKIVKYEVLKEKMGEPQEIIELQDLDLTFKVYGSYKDLLIYKLPTAKAKAAKQAKAVEARNYILNHSESDIVEFKELNSEDIICLKVNEEIKYYFKNSGDYDAQLFNDTIELYDIEKIKIEEDKIFLDDKRAYTTNNPTNTKLELNIKEENIEEETHEPSSIEPIIPKRLFHWECYDKGEMRSKMKNMISYFEESKWVTSSKFESTSRFNGMGFDEASDDYDNFKNLMYELIFPPKDGNEKILQYLPDYPYTYEKGKIKGLHLPSLSPDIYHYYDEYEYLSAEGDPIEGNTINEKDIRTKLCKPELINKPWTAYYNDSSVTQAYYIYIPVPNLNKDSFEYNIINKLNQYKSDYKYKKVYVTLKIQGDKCAIIISGSRKSFGKNNLEFYKNILLADITDITEIGEAPKNEKMEELEAVTIEQHELYEKSLRKKLDKIIDVTDLKPNQTFIVKTNGKYFSFRLDLDKKYIFEGFKEDPYLKKKEEKYSISDEFKFLMTDVGLSSYQKYNLENFFRSDMITMYFIDTILSASYDDEEIVIKFEDFEEKWNKFKTGFFTITSEIRGLATEIDYYILMKNKAAADATAEETKKAVADALAEEKKKAVDAPSAVITKMATRSAAKAPADAKAAADAKVAAAEAAEAAEAAAAAAAVAAEAAAAVADEAFKNILENLEKLREKMSKLLVENSEIKNKYDTQMYLLKDVELRYNLAMVIIKKNEKKAWDMKICRYLDNYVIHGDVTGNTYATDKKIQINTRKIPVSTLNKEIYEFVTSLCNENPDIQQVYYEPWSPEKEEAEEKKLYATQKNIFINDTTLSVKPDVKSSKTSPKKSEAKPSQRTIWDKYFIPP